MLPPAIPLPEGDIGFDLCPRPMQSGGSVVPLNCMLCHVLQDCSNPGQCLQLPCSDRVPKYQIALALSVRSKEVIRQEHAHTRQQVFPIPTKQFTGKAYDL